MMPLRLFSVFHLNLAYSSIEEEQRPEVVRRCYWPLLRLCREHKFPAGIEASGYTLAEIASIDPGWVKELRHLCSDGLCEFIGSGYAQLIGPLVPPEVNEANLRLGNMVYESLLGHRPRIALVNEQAYSTGLVGHYENAGYRAILMEWDNPASCHDEWETGWRYLPQVAVGEKGAEIQLLWNNSISFQKFQRYAHGDMTLEAYVGYLEKHVAETARAFSLYGNDVEIFDFRPGRYHTEPELAAEGEWQRIGRLFEELQADNRFLVVRPGEVLRMMKAPGAGNRLRLESPGQPIPVKKQGKYNVTRWAVTGRDDLGINTACWRIYEALREGRSGSDADWRELCYLWSSDFRTHITEKRWTRFLERLDRFERRITHGKSARPDDSLDRHVGNGCVAYRGPRSSDVNVRRQDRYLTVESDLVRVRLDCKRGLAVSAMWFKGTSEEFLCGTLPHGYYDDIRMGADFYTGHVTMEFPGQAKVTSLNAVEPTIGEEDYGQVIRGSVNTPLGPIHQEIHVPSGIAQMRIRYELEWETIPAGSLRLGHITLNPAAFDRDTLYFRTHNGGYGEETFPVAGGDIDHGSAVSFLVSACNGIGVTGGVVELGDVRRALRVLIDKTESAMIGLVTYRRVGETYFYRVSFSAVEMDETRNAKVAKRDHIRANIVIGL
jgi:hypothetical protein